MSSGAWPRRPPIDPLADDFKAGTKETSPVQQGEDGVQRVYLHAGMLFVNRQPAEIRIILGSCVSLCLWDQRNHWGGANHYLLPEGSPSGLRMGDVSCKTLLERLETLGSKKSDLIAKIFGGACVLSGGVEMGSHLGERNIEMALSFVEKEGISVAAQDVGGNQGRKLIYRTGDGLVMLKYL